MPKSAKKAISKITKKTVIIVDDSTLARQLVKRIFEKIKYDVVAEAADGGEAIELYKKYKPSLLTIDMLMPNVKGIEVIRRIIKDDPQAKILVISALGMMGEEAIRAGAKDFIQKPFLVSELVQKIEEIMKK